MTIRAKAIAHAAACRAALAAGEPRPRWQGGSLADADLSGADITGCNFTDALIDIEQLDAAVNNQAAAV